MTTAEILAGFPRLAALVVGGICLNRWCTYDPSVSEPSRETGIPRIGVVSTGVTPDAGGTVANNLAAFGQAESRCWASAVTTASASNSSERWLLEGSPHS
jgi:hypothetical protein